MDGLIARGNSARSYQLADLFLHYIPGLSHVDACDTIGWVSDQGKTNQVDFLALVQGPETILTSKCILGCRILEAIGNGGII